MPEITSTKYLVTATWDDAPHLTKEEKEQLWGSIPPFQRDARSKGIPQLGAGAIWPVDEQRIKCDPFEIPSFWPRAFALDVGWKCTAAMWGAWDRESNTVYVFSSYKQGLAEPATHTEALRSRGFWIPGVIDPAAAGRSQKDGTRLIDEYQDLGLDIAPAENAVEAGIYAVFRRFVSDRLKIFSTCTDFFDEYRLYRRDDDGKIVKENDHLCDCLRYLIMSGMMRAMTEAEATFENEIYEERNGGRNKTTGY